MHNCKVMERWAYRARGNYSGGWKGGMGEGRQKAEREKEGGGREGLQEEQLGASE